jgi:hypothetical protein
MPDESVAKPSGSRLTSWSTDSDRHPVGIVLGGEPIVIPGRMYTDEVRPVHAPDHLQG